MGIDNVLVKLNFNKLLMVVKLSVLATRVVDSGLKPAFRYYVRELDASTET